MPSNGLDCGLCADSHLDRLAEGLADTGGSRADEDHETRRQSSMNQRPSLMFIKDLQGRYVHVNDCFARAFALDPKGIISHTDAQLFPAEVAAQFRANDARALATGGAVEVEEVARYGDGAWHTSIVQKFPLLDGNGRVTALGGVVTPITERKRAEEALEQITLNGPPPGLKRAASVHLASAIERTGGAQEVQTGAHPALANHAALTTAWLDDIAAKWDEDLRSALMQAAFLARLTRSAVAEITGRSGVFEALERLVDAGVLVHRDHSIPTVLRFDPRFRAHLQELARRTLQPAELTALLWRTTALMERELEPQHRKAVPPAPAIRICALGGFLILRGGTPLPRHRKPLCNPLTLLKALVALGPSAVPSHRLADLLWPDAEGDHANASLTITLHRTRGLLGVPEAILNDNGELSLNRELVSCDVVDFHHALQRIETQQHSAQESASLLLQAYAGPLLPACTGEAWLQPCRERLAAKFAAAVARVGGQLEAETRRAEAQALYLEALSREPLAVCLKRFL